MNIKKATEIEARPFDVTEWNPEQKAFFKPLAGYDALAVNDEWFAFNDKDRTREERFRAAYNVAKRTLVDDTGAPLLTDEDYEAIKAASFQPLARLWRYVVNPDHVDETFKKK